MLCPTGPAEHGHDPAASQPLYAPLAFPQRGSVRAIRSQAKMRQYGVNNILYGTVFWVLPPHRWLGHGTGRTQSTDQFNDKRGSPTVARRCGPGSRSIGGSGSALSCMGPREGLAPDEAPLAR